MSVNMHYPNIEAQLRLENEMKMLNFEIDGAFFRNMSDDMPLDLDKQFLDNILAFETQSKNAKSTTIYSFLGEPEFLPFDILRPEEVETNIERLFKIMDKHDIYLDFLCEYSLETMYRFITDEFMNHEISDMRIPGMNHGFIYEEFHPNHEYDLKNDAENFFNSIMNLKSDFKMYFLSPNMVKSTASELVDKIVYEKRIESFRNYYNKLRINQFEIIDVEIKDINKSTKFAGVKFILDYEGILKSNNAKVESCGKGYLSFVFTDDYWTISCIVFKGFH
jgi:hypothetical protein